MPNWQFAPLELKLKLEKNRSTTTTEKEHHKPKNIDDLTDSKKLTTYYIKLGMVVQIYYSNS